MALIVVVPEITTAFTSSVIPTVLNTNKCSSSVLWDGVGVAKDYEWLEDFMEIEIRVKVPKEIRPKNIHFTAKPFSIDLRYDATETEEDTTVVLLDSSRKLRGRVACDGTFWNIEENDTTDSRTIVVTLEKNIRPPADDFDTIDYDWGGVYLEETEDEIISRNYTDLEEMDIREYAGRMGVDIDNINMSQVDKTMFSSGLLSKEANMTQSTVDKLRERGLATEVTQQKDGTEYVTDDEGYKVPFQQPYDAAVEDDDDDVKPEIPFLDTDSPWKTMKPSYKMDELVKELQEADDTNNSITVPLVKKEEEPPKKEEAIDLSQFTIPHLKQLLREEKLKVSGNKSDLIQRLSTHYRTSQNVNTE